MADITREEAARVLTDLADAFSKHELTKNTACISALRMGAAALYEELKDRATERVDVAPGFDSIRPEGKE